MTKGRGEIKLKSWQLFCCQAPPPSQPAPQQKMSSLRDKIIAVYEKLAIAVPVSCQQADSAERVEHRSTPVPINVCGGETNPAPIYERIYEAIAEDPVGRRPVLDSIVEDKVFISYFAPYTRLELSALYPADLELTTRLLIDTISYYKRKSIYYRGGEPDDDREDIYWYSHIGHCPDIYFRREMDWMYHSACGATLRAVLDNIGVTATEITYNRLPPKLWAFYESRKK